MTNHIPVSTVSALPPSGTLYGLYATWPRFRFAERELGARWEVVAAVDDAALAKAGYQLGGQIRDASELDQTYQAELTTLLQRTGTLSDEDDARLAALLECCPFAENLPPIDVDPQGGATPEQIVEFARKFDEAWRTTGLGTIQWFTTGGRGLHGHLALPRGVKHTHLMRAFGGLVRRVARDANLPLLTNFRSREGRPPILLDDSLFDRDAAGRGGLWRLSGAPHTKTGRLKQLATNLPTDPATVTEELARRLAQSVDALAEVDEHGEQRRKPRAKTGKLPPPLTQLQNVQKLKHVSEAVAKALPPEGHRHKFRQALCGWLLREGVPVRTVGATVAVAGDPQDGVAAAKTTASRLHGGRNAYGFRSLVDVVGAGGAAALKHALFLDFEDAKVPPKELGALPTDGDRVVLREAARIAAERGEEGRALHFRRAARCGLAKQKSYCKVCRKVTSCRHLIAERATCPHCAQRRAVSIVNWCMTKWPDRMWVFTLKLPDQKLETARAARKTWSRKLRPIRRGNVRWIVAPGYLVALTADFHTGAIMNGWDIYDWQKPEGGLPNEQTRTGVVMALVPVLKARSLHLRRYLDTGDPEALAEDSWTDKVMEATGGKAARAALPWPKKRDLRLMAVNAARARRNEEPLAKGATFPTLAERLLERTACCFSRQDHELIDSKTEEVIAVRDDRPWTFAEGSVRAENGWRGEELRFDDHGVATVVVPPPGFAEHRLRE